MPVAKLPASGAPNAMKSVEGNDSLDTVISQAIGKEPLSSFSRTGDSPVQWIQLLNALDQQDVPGWPLLTPLKAQMLKCEKCSREFCSPINYRRHIRMHRRSLNVDKESHKNRDLLCEFWDKLSLDEAKEVASFDDVSLKEISGSSVIKALAISLRKPGVWTLPQVYVKAGSILLDVIQAKFSRLPYSQELFSILDDASERTFLCAGTAESVQRYVIEGESEKALELKNLVACASLLFEQKLVKAWLADKDAEALRCQKLLVEEEEAAQKRQDQLLERRKQKKLRQKEQKAREQSNSEVADASADSVNGQVSGEILIPSVPADPNSIDADILADMTSCPDQIQYSSKETDEDIEAEFNASIDHIDVGSVQNVDSLVELSNGHWHITTNKWQVPKSPWSGRNGFHGSQNLQAFKLEPAQKQGPLKDRSTLVNGGKVWNRKPKLKVDDESSRFKLQKVAAHQVDRSNCELMIGSISVQVSNCTAQQRQSSQGAPTGCGAQHTIPENETVRERIQKSDAVQSGRKPEVAKRWRPICVSETRGPLPAQRGHRDSEEAVTLGKAEDQTISGTICLQSCVADTDDVSSQNYCSQVIERPEGLHFSSIDAKAFLAERWKEAISEVHVQLVLSPEPEPENYYSATLSPSDIHGPNALGDAEDRPDGVGTPLPFTEGNAKAKFRMKPQKGGVTKVKYIPKQKVAT